MMAALPYRPRLTPEQREAPEFLASDHKVPQRSCSWSSMGSTAT
jgi:hypothetical protein